MLHQTIEAATRPGPEGKWTPEVRTQFLDHLARKGSVRAACLRVGVSAEIAYRLRRRDPAFARGWAAAMVLARRETEQVLAEQAVEGIVEDVYYRGEWVGSKRRYDARLLLAHLARLDKLADDPQARADAERFDEILAVVAGEELPDEIACPDDVLPASRRRHVAGAARIARTEQLRAEFAREAEEQEQSADEDGEDCPLDEEQRWQRDVWAAEMREAACDDAADEAAFVAGEEWDAWQARACATVDRVLAAAPPFPRPEPGDGPAPSATCGAEEAASEPRQQCQQFPGGDG